MCCHAPPPQNRVFTRCLKNGNFHQIVIFDIGKIFQYDDLMKYDDLIKISVWEQFLANLYESHTLTLY